MSYSHKERSEKTMGSAVKWASINFELTLFSWFLLISYFIEDYFRFIFLLCKSSHIFVFFFQFDPMGNKLHDQKVIHIQA